MIKFLELIKHDPHFNYAKEVFDTKTEYQDGNIVKTISSKIPDFDVNKEVSLVCYWFYGGLAKDEIIEINIALANKDWNVLQLIKSRHYKDGLFTRLPSHVVAYYDNYCLGATEMDEYLLQKLDEDDSEHG